MAIVRYLVHDVDAAVDFYVNQLGFTLTRRMGPAFAIVGRGDLALWVSGPRTSAAQPMPDGRTPQPGGWNRLVIEITELDVLVAELGASGSTFRNDPVSGPGGTQILVEDPSGNPVELFQPA